MNCKPGDLAIIIKDANTAKTAGMLVEVLHLAPMRDFRLPDGEWHLHPSTPDQWVCKLGHAVAAPMYKRGHPTGTRMAHYGCISDRYLRPLPPPESVDSEDEVECCPVSEVEQRG